MTHDDDDDDDDDGNHYDGFRGDQHDPFDSTWRFGFTFGPNGMQIQEPPAFGHILREMEEMFSELGRWDRPQEPGHFGKKKRKETHSKLVDLNVIFSCRYGLCFPHVLDVPSIMPPPPPQDTPERGGGNPLRDFMLKSPNSDQPGPQPGPSRGPRNDAHPSFESPDFPSSPFHGWTPFSRVIRS